MAYSDTIQLVVGDTLPLLTITLRDANQAVAGSVLDPQNAATWAPINLVGATVKLKIRELGSATVKTVLTCSISNASGGEVTTGFPTGTLDTAGTFEGEIEITFLDGGIQTLVDLLKLKVRADF